MWTIISGIFGGFLRLAPEILKYFNAKQEMKHELDMQEKAYQFQVLKGNQVLDEIGAQGKADWDMGGLAALKEAIKGQDVPIPISGIKFVDFFGAFANVLNKLVRPVITFQWVVFLYPGVIITKLYILLKSNVGVLPALDMVFGEPEKALVAFLIDFWFIGRVLDAGRKRNG